MVLNNSNKVTVKTPISNDIEKRWNASEVYVLHRKPAVRKHGKSQERCQYARCRLYLLSTFEVSQQECWIMQWLCVQDFAPFRSAVLVLGAQNHCSNSAKMSDMTHTATTAISSENIWQCPSSPYHRQSFRCYTACGHGTIICPWLHIADMMMPLPRQLQLSNAPMIIHSSFSPSNDRAITVTGCASLAQRCCQLVACMHICASCTSHC
jgi:hypothetical protein